MRTAQQNGSSSRNQKLSVRNACEDSLQQRLDSDKPSTRPQLKIAVALNTTFYLKGRYGKGNNFV